MILDAREICSSIGVEISTFIHNIILLIKIAVPIVLVILGMIDLGKGVVASKEDEIKKGQHTFIKRLIAGIIVFFIVSLTQLVIGIIDKESAGEFWNCANKIMNGTVDEPLTQEEKDEERFRIIEQCCIAADAEVIKNEREDGTKSTSCNTTEENEQKYNACYDRKMSIIEEE